MEERLVEAGLELLSDDQNLIVAGAEPLRDLRRGEAVHPLLGVADPLVVHPAGKGHQRVEVRVALLGDVLVQRLLVADGVEAGGGDHHGLGLSADLGSGMSPEVLDDDLGLLGEVGGVQGDEPGDGPSGLTGLVSRVVADGLLDPPQRLVRGVVLEDVEDEPLVNGLTHGVEVEWVEEARHRVAGPEHLEGLGLRGGGESEEREVGLLRAPENRFGDGLLGLVDGVRDKTGVLGFGPGHLLLLGRSEDHFQVLGRLPRLRGVRLIDDDRVASVGKSLAKLLDLLEHEGKLLEGGDHDLGLFPLQGLQELL